MIPNVHQDRAEAMLRMYSEAEEEMLRRIGKSLSEVDQADVPAWVRRKLSEMEKMRRTLVEGLQSLEKRSAAERRELVVEAFDEGAGSFFRELGLEQVGITRSRQLIALIDELDGRFSELHGRILRNTQDVYRDILGEALPMAMMGAESTRQAIQRALNRFADRGITAFTDVAGRCWGMAEYAEMAVRTGMMNASLAGYTQEALAHGEDLVIITDHADECPLCEPWERRVLSLTGAQRNHPDCDGTLDEAKRAGLFHPNCLHAMTVYVPGLTDRSPGRRAGKEQTGGYAGRQAQRYMERMVRRWKRRQAAAISPEEERYAKAHVDQWQKKLRAAVSRSKLPRKYSREGGRVLLSEAAKKMKPLHVGENGRLLKYESRKTHAVSNQLTKRSIDSIMLTSKQDGDDGVKTIGSICTEYLERTFGPMNTDVVVLTEERAQHIRMRHPEDWELFEKYGVATIESPDVVLKDEKHKGTIYMIKKLQTTNLNTIVRLSVAEEDDPSKKNSVMTFYRIRTSNLNKMILKNEVLYKKE